MATAIKIIQALLPVVIELIRVAHPDKTDEEHKQIVRALIDQHLDR